jgi:hypothetical protein
MSLRFADPIAKIEDYLLAQYQMVIEWKNTHLLLILCFIIGDVV